ncbi:forkhead-associated domain-containing protein 1-like isoform X2 [Halichondria panicea]|uniref:forkhead-associated domain-containing protein 1-like isoform X2 n=1 Tax=Halichondria panicea TaxID=6063 RepID=UPI00312B9739
METDAATEEQSEMASSSATECHSYRCMSREELCAALVEKEYKLECAGDQLQSLSVYKDECGRKDGVIVELRRELAAYKHNSHTKDISYVTMEEHLSACEHHLQLKTSEVDKLTQEAKSWKEKASTAESKLGMLGTGTSSGKINVLQKELSTKKSEILKQKQELQQLRAQQQTEKDSGDSLRHQVAELQANLSSVQSKMKQSKSSNDDLKMQLQRSECDRERASVAEQRRKEELGKLKSSVCDGRLAQAKQNFLEAQVERTKLKEGELAVQLGKVKEEAQAKLDFLAAEVERAKLNESELAVQLGKVKEELCTTCERVVTMTAQVLPPADEESGGPVEAVEQLTSEYTTVTEQLQTTQTQLTEVQADIETANATITMLTQLWTDFKCGVGSCDLTQSSLDTLMATLSGLSSQEQTNSCQTLINAMKESLNVLNTELVAKWVQLVAEIGGHCSRLELSSEETIEPVAKLALLIEKIDSQIAESIQLQVKLQGVEEGHLAEVAALRGAEEERVVTAVQESLVIERGKVINEMQALEQRLEADKHEAVANEQRNNSILSEQLTTVKESLLAERNEKDVLKAEKTGLETELASLEVAMREALTTADVAKETVRTTLMQETIGYREQSHQHALTIVALEEKLMASMERCKQLRGENEALSQVVSGGSGTAQGEEDKVKKLTKLTDTLRHQLSLANDGCTKSQRRIKLLESDLLTVRKQIKDREDDITRQFQEQLSDLQLTLSKQETSLEGKRSEVTHLQSVLQEKTTSLTAIIETERCDAEHKLLEMRNQLTHSSHVGSSGLAQVGQRCTGEKHCDTIASQRRALSQLRDHIQELELTKPPVGSHQATLKELSRVRHELFKAKARVSLTATPAQPEPEDAFTLPAVEGEESVRKIQDLESSVLKLRDAVECSERTVTSSWLRSSVRTCMTWIAQPLKVWGTDRVRKKDKTFSKRGKSLPKQFLDDSRR